MRIAIPTFGRRVSPRFDCASTLLFVTIDDVAPSERFECETLDWTPRRRIDRIVEFRADAVLCGGIDHASSAVLQEAGITVIDGVVGTVDMALTAFLAGSLDERLLGPIDRRQSGQHWPTIQRGRSHVKSATTGITTAAAMKENEGSNEGKRRKTGNC